MQLLKLAKPTNSQAIEDMKRPTVREHAMDTVWENGTRIHARTFAKVCTRNQLI
ncbi:hypothetical protein AB7849_08775 [Rhodanobacter sp. 115]|uniref:hypothetical protein n=1 Tax=Rhodanobacter sp. FW021-MT20 TaxID=1162282 RepID=UPI0012F8D426|nr:hypothetical protein [Rhodanobacter sp. 115]